MTDRIEDLMIYIKLIDMQLKGLEGKIEELKVERKKYSREKFLLECNAGVHGEVMLNGEPKVWTDEEIYGNESNSEE